MAADPLLFEAVIVPHRSLSRAGRRRLTFALALLCTIDAAVFVALGAWPVAGFSGLEVLLAVVLIAIHARAARASEIVLLTPSALRIVRVDQAGRREERAMVAAWLGISLEEVTGRVPRLIVRSRAERQEIGRSLGEAEKRELAAALDDALHRLRHPSFDNPQLRGPGPGESVSASDFINSKTDFRAASVGMP